MGHFELSGWNSQMALKKLSFDDDNRQVPWLKDFYEDNPEHTDPIRVDWVKISPKGLLLMNVAYAKAFVFKGKKLYTHLLGALEHFSDSENEFPYFYMGCDSDGNLEVYQSDSENTHYVREGKNEFQTTDGKNSKKLKQLEDNPFIKNSPPPSPPRASKRTQPPG